jgi:glycopeptide antibiotics resistance protein
MYVRPPHCGVHFETYGLLVGLALFAFVADSAGRRHLGSDRVLAACLLAIFAVTLVPAHGARQLQLRPGQAAPLGDVANLILFAPLGGVLFLRRWPMVRTVLAALLLSAGIELAQRVIPGRTTSLDDVVFNTLGGVVGWLLARDLSSRFTG